MGNYHDFPGEMIVMNKYSSVENALESLFSVEVGLSDEDAFTLFDGMLANKDYRDNFEAELRAIFADPSVIIDDASRKSALLCLSR